MLRRVGCWLAHRLLPSHAVCCAGVVCMSCPAADIAARLCCVARGRQQAVWQPRVSVRPSQQRAVGHQPRQRPWQAAAAAAAVASGPSSSGSGSGPGGRSCIGAAPAAAWPAPAIWTADVQSSRVASSSGHLRSSSSRRTRRGGVAERGCACARAAGVPQEQQAAVRGSSARAGAGGRGWRGVGGGSQR